MLTAFLMGLFAVLATIAIVAVVVMTARWIKNYILNRLKNRDAHKVAFADTREVVSDYLRQADAEEDGISMDDLERMCSETPYVAADIDEEGNITNYEGVKAEQTDSKLKQAFRAQDGMVVVER